MQYVSCAVCGGTGQVPTPESLREKRLAKGLRLIDVAARAGVGTPYLSDVETGKRAVTLKIAKVYKEL